MNTPNEIEIPLVVDLDGTLLRTDLLLESANHSLKSNPLSVFGMVAALFKGRSALKAKLAEKMVPDFSELPVNDEVIEWARTEKKRGRKLVLATASHEKLASGVSRNLGFFDEVLATNDAGNLKSNRKRDVLIEKFGERGFDYVGDSPADKPVWKAARYSYAVSPSQTILLWLQENTDLKKVFDSDPKNTPKAFIRGLRPHQWAKNLLIFVPVLTAHLYTDVALVWACLLAFVAFSLTASSVYLLNDLIDIADDRHHPEKRNRPFASGQLSILVGWAAWPILLALAVCMGIFFMPATFTVTLAVYYVMAVGYSFYLKSLPVADVLTLAGMYILRLMAGAAVLGLSLSFWLLLFSGSLFLSLAFMKRVGEFKLLLRVRNGAEQHLRGRGYTKEDLEFVSIMGMTSGLVSVVFLALYVQSQEGKGFYESPELVWLSCPLLLFWIVRAWLIANRGTMHDDPVAFTLRDKTSWIVGGLFALVFLLGRHMS